MVKITFPSSDIKEFSIGVTGLEVAKSISSSLAKKALAVAINGQVADLRTPIKCDAAIQIITDTDPRGLEVLRHDTAHILAEAAKRLFPEVQVTIGPSIENGFYYDFATKEPFTTSDLALLEKEMHKIAKENAPFERITWSKEQAVSYFTSIGEHYKVELINAIAPDQEITVYKQGQFIDLCRGPHALSTGYIKHFKLMKVSGAYWRGDSKNQMLQRVYGTAWFSQQDLDHYLHMLEEAEKRDHRKIGKELSLFHLQEEAPGMVFWHEKGYTLWRIIENYIRSKIEKCGYIEVKTPIIADRKLWEASGHWDKFGQNMFTCQVAEEVMAPKPMNCPLHVQIFKQGIKSYRDLPIRMAEFGCCHRYEPSGALHGILRVRSFTQDDAHIFCTEEQIVDETISFCKLLIEVYRDFGFEKVAVKFSDRPSTRAGNDTTWDRAETSLKQALEAANLEYSLNPGEGAFYGPKLEFVLKDAVGRDWQLGTLQLDFILPERLGAHYITKDGAKARPVMMHRAIIGSFERFIGMLLEHYSGRLPLWLAPVQVAIATITNTVDPYAQSVYNELVNNKIRCILDISADKINYKIRNLFVQKIPIIVIIGKEEQTTEQLTVRKVGFDDKTEVKMSLIELIKFVGSKNLI